MYILYVPVNASYGEWWRMLNGAGKKHTWGAGDGEDSKERIWRILVLLRNKDHLTAILALIPPLATYHMNLLPLSPLQSLHKSSLFPLTWKTAMEDPTA